MAAAARGATPVSSPARPAPTAATVRYQRRNATAVTMTARYPAAAHWAGPMAGRSAGRSVSSVSTPSITAPSHTACTDTPHGPCRRSTGTASSVKAASQASASAAQATPAASVRPVPSTRTAPATTTAAASRILGRGPRPSSSGPSTPRTTGTEATATAITAGSACATPRTTATLNSTSPVAAIPASHSHSRPRGRRIGTRAARANASRSRVAAA